MAQEKILFNGIAIKQPDSGDLESSFETTYTEDSGRPINGVLHITPLFTVESYSYSATNLTLQEMTQILKIIAKGKQIHAIPIKIHSMIFPITFVIVS